MTYSDHNTGVLTSDAELESSAGVAKLEGRPNAGAPGDTVYAVEEPLAPSGNRSGVLTSQAAVLDHGS